MREGGGEGGGEEGREVGREMSRMGTGIGPTPQGSVTIWSMCMRRMRRMHALLLLLRVLGYGWPFAG